MTEILEYYDPENDIEYKDDLISDLNMLEEAAEAFLGALEDLRCDSSGLVNGIKKQIGDMKYLLKIWDIAIKDARKEHSQDPNQEARESLEGELL